MRRHKNIRHKMKNHIHIFIVLYKEQIEGMLDQHDDKASFTLTAADD